ncbi:pirin family protein [Pseudomonas sp. Pseu.R1]|uniref:pirin family protein n=1 Tax=Pseudomonas sp. Pseu.R1 TaxID=3379818 RepID=UPI003B92DB94
MSIKFSPVAQASYSAFSAHFSAHRLNVDAMNGLAAPVIGFDHFRTSGPTFPPHPHAGFSAVSYLFEDSAGGLRNRDSLGHDIVIEPGAMVWTQAARGVVHDEQPATPGIEVHGLQLFVNLSKANKTLAPAMLHADSDQIPSVTTEGAHIRVVAGTLNGVTGPIKPAEPFSFFDLKLESRFSLNLVDRQNVMFYVLSGNLEIEGSGEQHQLSAHEAISLSYGAEPDHVSITTDAGAHLLILSGVDPKEPIAAYGPFVMNDQAGLQAAYSRYVAGEMGRLSPL